MEKFIEYVLGRPWASAIFSAAVSVFLYTIIYFLFLFPENGYWVGFTFSFIFPIIIAYPTTYYILQKSDHIKQVNVLLKQQKQQLRTEASLRNYLLAVIGHDMRSPLANIISTLSLAEDGIITADEWKGLAPRLKKEVAFTKEMLDRMVYWAKLRMKEVTVDFDPFRPDSLEERIQDYFVNQLHGKDISLEMNLKWPHQNLLVDTDKEAFYIVLTNLLNNAIKHSGKRGEIKVSLTRDGNRAFFVVEDNGPGMKRETLDSIFSSSIDNPEDVAKAGGIGLFLCKELVALNKGLIWAESEPGVGSKFFVSLPLVQTSGKVQNVLNTF